MARKTPEGRFSDELDKELRRMFPGCYIFKQDEQLYQGIPDKLIIYKDRWAMLEIKKSEDAARQPNQDYYVDEFDGMSFAAFIYPENRQEVLSALQHTFESDR